MMPNLAFATQLVPLRKISEAAKTMDEKWNGYSWYRIRLTTRKGWVWNCAIGAIPQGRDEVL